MIINNGIQTSPTKKSIDDIDDKSILKTPFQIPSPTIRLPNEFSSSSNIKRSTPVENNRNLFIFNQSTSTINSFQSLHTSHHESFILHKSSRNSISSSQQIFPTNRPSLILSESVDKPVLSNRIFPSPRISLSEIINDHDLHSNPNSTLSQEFESPGFIQQELMTSQNQIRHEIKHQSESLWKTKLTLKTILSMANRYDAQALKDRKPIDYHMFLTTKFTKNPILQYNDHIDMKFIHQKKQSVFNEHDYRENRILYKRLLDTMSLRKPVNITKPQSITSFKQIKKRRKTKAKASMDDSLEYSNEKPILITYQAVPISRRDSDKN